MNTKSGGHCDRRPGWRSFGAVRVKGGVRRIFLPINDINDTIKKSVLGDGVFTEKGKGKGERAGRTPTIILVFTRSS